MRLSNLPPSAVDRLRESYKQAKHPQEKERYHALWLKARSHTREEICQLLGIGARTLGRWIQHYNKFGLSGLRNKPQGGNHRYLSNEQKVQIKELIHEKEPRGLGYDGRFWDLDKLRRLVKDKFGVELRSVIIVSFG